MNENFACGEIDDRGLVTPTNDFGYLAMNYANVVPL